jgi:PKD repeat protein
MKRPRLILLFLFFGWLNSFAQQPDDMIIAGTVINNSTFLPVPNYPVIIEADSLVPSLSTYLTTDASGNFQLLVPNGSLLGQNIQYSISTFGCNQNFTVQTDNNNGNTDSTFSQLTICVSASPSCNTGFSFYNNPYSPSPALFVFSDTSITSNNIFWQWNFGNGAIVEGTTDSIANYIFPTIGVHQVCLSTINTDGCLQTHCDSVISGAVGSCIATVTVATDTTNITASFTLDIVPVSLTQLTSYTIYFGDGDSLQVNSTISPLTLIHQYDSIGIYNATISIINAAGCADFVTTSVNFTSTSCLADFFSTQIPSPPGSVYYTNTSTPGAVLYEWDFGDNSPIDTATSPIHVYQFSGTYNVCLTATYPNGCTDTHCNIINVSFTPACFAQYTWFANTQAGPNGIQIQNLSTLPFGGTFSFNAGDGSPTFILPTQIYLYNYSLPGTYFACLTINGPNCTSSFCDSIIVLSSGCTGNLYASQITGYTATFNSTFNPFVAGDTLTVYYDYGDGNQDTLDFFSNNITNPYTFAQAGTYQICANMNSSSGCVALVCTTLTINPLCDAFFTYVANSDGPPGDYILEDSSSSPATITNWSWNLNGTLINGIDSLNFTFPNVGVNTACLTISTNDGCQGVYCDTIIYSPPVGCDVILDSLLVPSTLPGLIQVYYNYSPFILGETLNYEYQWGDGNTDSGILGQTPSALALHPYMPGYYPACIKISNSAGCVDSICFPIDYQPTQLALEIRLRDVQTNYLNDMTIYVMQYDSTSSLLVPIDTSLLSNSSDVYYKNLPFGSYLVKGSLDASNPLSNNYLPTYFGDNLYWNSGVLINPSGVMTNLNNNYFPVFIDMATGIVPAGPCSITGFIHEDINNPSGDPLAGIDVLLLSYQGVAIGHTKTNSAGAYSFANLPYGIYFVFPEVINHITYPVMVTLNIAQPQAENVNLGVDAQIIQSIAQEENNTPLFYPNPAQNLVHFYIDHQSPFSKVEIISTEGKLLHERLIQSGEKNLNLEVSGLSNGLYFIRFTEPNSVITEKLLISR